MQYIIANIKRENKTGSYGNYVSITIQTQDGQTIYCNEKKGFTEALRQGGILDVQDSWVQQKTSSRGKSYLQIKWPSAHQQQFTPSAPQMNDAIKLQLERIEKKLDRLLGASVAVMPFDEEAPLPKGLPTDIPPPPSDDDNYDNREDSPF